MLIEGFNNLELHFSIDFL